MPAQPPTRQSLPARDPQPNLLFGAPKQGGDQASRRYGGGESGQPMSSKNKTSRGRAAPVDKVMSLAEEKLRIAKRAVVTERVRVRTITETAEQLIRQELRGERVEVERIQTDTLIELGAQPPQIRTEGNVTIIPILEEVLVVEKRLLLKEELRVTRHATTEFTETPVTVRKQRAVVERLNSEGVPTTEPMEKQ